MQNEDFPGEGTRYRKFKCANTNCKNIIYKPGNYPADARQFCSNPCVGEYYEAIFPGYKRHDPRIVRPVAD